MLKIRGMDIYYIRGDDDSFSIQPTADDGTEITDFTGVFSVKKNHDDTEYVLQYQITSNGVVTLTHEKTKDLSYGDYLWDAELILSDGTHQTIGPGKLHMKPDVTV